MLYLIEGFGNIDQVDFRLYTPEYLSELGLLAVGLAEPTAGNVILPGTQLSVTIDESNELKLDETGMTLGTDDLRVATGGMLRQVAYRSGLPPGHFGLHGLNDQNTEFLASDRAVSVIADRANKGPFVGFLGLVDQAYFNLRGGHANGPATRRELAVHQYLGVTLGDVDSIVGSRGLAMLADTVDHPVVSRQLAHHGLRVND